MGIEEVNSQWVCPVPIFWVGRSLRCQAVVNQPHGIHRLATVATPGRANHSEPQAAKSIQNCLDFDLFFWKTRNSVRYSGV
jgi:hypothetical protein